MKPTLSRFFKITIILLFIWRFSSQSPWFVGADYTVIPCTTQINVLSEVLFAWLILLSERDHPCLRKTFMTCWLFWWSDQTAVWILILISANWCMCRKMWSLLNCKWDSSESKCSTVNISRPPLSPCVALIMQFLQSPHVALKFKTLKWGIIEGMSLMVHSLSVQWQLLLIKALQDKNEGFPWCWTGAFMFLAQWERLVCCLTIGWTSDVSASEIFW